MKVNLDTATKYNVKKLSLHGSFKIIIKKKVILQKGYDKYKPLSKNGFKQWHNKQRIFIVSRDLE